MLTLCLLLPLLFFTRSKTCAGEATCWCYIKGSPCRLRKLASASTSEQTEHTGGICKMIIRANMLQRDELR